MGRKFNALKRTKNLKREQGIFRESHKIPRSRFRFFGLIIRTRQSKLDGFAQSDPARFDDVGGNANRRPAFFAVG